MVGCMLATSLAMAPAMLLAQFANFVDLDGPLLLKRDRAPGISFAGSLMHPAAAGAVGLILSKAKASAEAATDIAAMAK